MELSVIIPTYNGLNLLKKNLPLLLNELDLVESSEVIIIDNNSSDDTERYIRESAEIQYQKLKDNRGFSGAVNAGVNLAKGKYVLILNNDCVLKEKSIIALLDFLKNDNELIATQPVIYTHQNTIENIGYVVDLRIGKATEIRDIACDFSSHNKNIFATNSIYGLSAACLLIRSDIFRKIGMLDESFHSYLEDIDLFIRLVKQGYTFAPCLDATAVHAHMSTSRTMRGYKEWHDFSNWIRIIKKNYPVSYVFRNLLPLCIERLRNLKGYLSVIGS